MRGVVAGGVSGPVTARSGTLELLGPPGVWSATPRTEREAASVKRDEKLVQAGPGHVSCNIHKFW